MVVGMKSSRKKRLGTIHIKPGIFDDETYGIYIIPEDNQNVEYQLRSQIKTTEECQSPLFPLLFQLFQS